MKSVLTASAAFAAALILTTSAMISGCSSKPSDGQVRSALQESKFGETLEPYFEVRNLKVTDGLQRAENNYEADITYEVHFLQDAQDLAAAIKTEAKGMPGGDFGAAMALMALGMEYGDFKKGGMSARQERVRLIKAEKGWRIDE